MNIQISVISSDHFYYESYCYVLWNMGKTTITNKEVKYSSWKFSCCSSLKEVSTTITHIFHLAIKDTHSRLELFRNQKQDLMP